ncbi:MAG: bacteriophage abortive infection AbiH family protein [Bacteroidales bacterium]|nr:bacteriophage abortive infection AbiH family protein [Bacteroidales bacterium]MCL2130743.1 bacteriophage abortive infection AbiH family protein [Treponema sp.]
MNRIILIGNGFDKAHGMPTSYVDFLNNYYKGVTENTSNAYQSFKNEDLEVKANIPTSFRDVIDLQSVDSYQEFVRRIEILNDSKLITRNGYLNIAIDFSNNRFLGHISEEIGLKQWVDVENEYYKQLTSFNKPRRRDYLRLSIETLNNNLESIRKSLEKYLTKIEQDHSTDVAIPQIRKNIFSRFQLRDMSLPFIDVFVNDVAIKMASLREKEIFELAYDEYIKVYDNFGFNKKHIVDFSKLDLPKHILKHEIEKGGIPDYFLAPDNLLFLSFNYTHTEEKYIKPSSIVETIHIHGEINKENNSMIFGYGDESDDDYHQLEKLNDNKYLQNIKSIRYSDTDNYRKLISFLEIAPYQIFIMGHSCGTSDKTLLKAMFEHENCASIKPFFHKKSDTENNYSDIVSNISRNFKDKVLMRDRVVNKTFCEPLY